MLNYFPQIWHCTDCSWKGDYPVAYIEAETDEGIEYRGPKLPHPTCPRCDGHKFYVQTLPAKGSPEWDAMFEEMKETP